MTAEAPHAAGFADSAGSIGLIDADVPCLGCGYNLRGLDPGGGRCPECGQPVGPSLRDAAAGGGRSLASSDPRWVTELAAGAAFMFAAAAWGQWPGLSLLSGDWRRDAAAWAPSVLTVFGVWLLDGREPARFPGAPRPADARPLRWALRACAAGYFVLPLTWMTITLVEPPSSYADPAIFAACAAVSLLALPVTALAYVRLYALARRLGRRSLRWQALALAVVAPVAMALLPGWFAYRNQDDWQYWYLYYMPVPGAGLPSLTPLVLTELLRPVAGLPSRMEFDTASRAGAMLLGAAVALWAAGFWAAAAVALWRGRARRPRGAGESSGHRP